MAQPWHRYRLSRRLGLREQKSTGLTMAWAFTWGAGLLPELQQPQDSKVGRLPVDRHGLIGKLK